MKLYDMTGAPNPRRVRIFLAEKGIEIETVQVNLMEGENLQDAFTSVNPRAIIPTLQLADGTVIDETSAICRYFEAEKPEPALYGSTPEEIGVIESWVRQIEVDAIGNVANILRNANPIFENRSVPGTNDTPQVPALVARGQQGLQSFFDRLNTQLAKHAYVAGEQYSAADITALCAIDFAGMVGANPDPELSNIAEWRARVSARPSAQA